MKTRWQNSAPVWYGKSVSPGPIWITTCRLMPVWSMCLYVSWGGLCPSEKWLHNLMYWPRWSATPDKVHSDQALLLVPMRSSSQQLLVLQNTPHTWLLSVLTCLSLVCAVILFQLSCIFWKPAWDIQPSCQWPETLVVLCQSARAVSRPPRPLCEEHNTKERDTQLGYLPDNVKSHWAGSCFEV